MPDNIIELKNQQAVILGNRGGGKTNLAVHIARQVPPGEVLVYDPLAEWAKLGYRAHVPKDGLDLDELDDYIRTVAVRAEPRIFIVDEASSIITTKHRLPPGLQMLSRHGRHYGMTVLWIGHRPMDINPNISEMADYLFIFRVSGAGNLVRLRNWHEDLPAAVRSLKDYEFAVLEHGQTVTVHAPVPIAK